ncbi:recombinase family protein [Acrocarpospora sp. B8E8]|uniref:recombinase family protein n=1 Tax=Acrocarpospora sp. B8E8 TaxID=3153572 RepID=UPI00325E789A
MRILAVKRISRDTEQSSALERQDAALTKAILEGGHTVGGWVEDATVSGAVNLDKRPSLGKWLREPLVHEWDAMMVTEQDRITRDDLHWAAFVGWVLNNNKTVIVLDDPSFDLSTPNGRMIANIKATQAANYRKTIQDKRLNQTKYFRDEMLWPGGTWPFGYRSVRFEHNGAKRWRLQIDPVTSALVREFYDRLIHLDHTVGQVIDDWNSRGILTPQEYQRHVNALEDREDRVQTLRGTQWSTTSAREMLRNPALMGHANTKKGVLKKNGLPVQWADPILSREEFALLQQFLDHRAKPYRGPNRAVHPLVGIFYCMCGMVYYTNSARERKDGPQVPYMLCRSVSIRQKCAFARSWKRALLEEALEEMFLTTAGDLEISFKTYVPGSDRTADIQELREALDNLSGSLAVLKPGSVAATAVLRAMEAHEENLHALEALPVIPSRWIEEGTGETFSEYWAAHPKLEDRCALLKKIGVRMYVGTGRKVPELDLHLPADLQARLVDALSNSVDPGFLTASAGMSESAMADYLATQQKVLADAMKASDEARRSPQHRR